VGAAVSSTVITDVLALVVLGLAVAGEGTATGGTTSGDDIALVPVWLGVVILAGFCLWALPRATDWFFVHVGHTRVQRFIWTIGGMAAGAFVSILSGIEGLVGAFLAGIGMNRLVPAHGQLMERIEFFGAALFVPAFLTTVGMSIDPTALTRAATVRLALVFIGIVVVGKTLAATSSGLIFGLTWTEIGIMSSLTVGQAAATLAIAQVGVATGILDQEVVDAAVIAVVISVIVSSFATRFFSRRMEPPEPETAAIGRLVLVRVPGNGSIEGVLDIGVAITRRDDGLLTPFVVCQDSGCATLEESLEAAVQGAIDRGQDSEGITRVSRSAVEGALDLAAETKASMILLPWDGPKFAGSLFFGNAIDEIGERSPIPVAAARLVGVDWDRVLCFDDRSRGFGVRREDGELALEIARRVASHKDLDLALYSTDPDLVDEPGQYAQVNQYSGKSREIMATVAPGDLLILPAFLAQDALGFGAQRVSRRLRDVSLVIVGGPRRLHVSPRQYGDRVLGRGGFHGPTRALSSSSRERPG
jgi:nucleotide-binding universal stress UspA family protein